MNAHRRVPAEKKSRPRRILFLRNSRGITDITGAETYLLNILGGLSAAGCSVHLVCSDILSKGETPWIRALKTRDVPHTIVDVPRTLSLADFTAARELVKSFKPDVLHAMDHRSDAVALWISARTKVPAVASFFGWTNWGRTTLRGVIYPIIDRTFMKRLQKIIVDSAQIGDQIRAPLRECQVAVIQNGVDLDRFDVNSVLRSFKTEWFGSEDVWLVGMIGRLHPNKGQLDMAEAAALLLERHPHMRFVVLGEPPPGYEDYASNLAARLKELGIADRFLVTNVATSEIPRAIASFDVTAIPSYMESLSYVMLESMAMKTPVISARVGGHVDLIRHGENGFLFQSGDVASLVELLSDLSMDAKLAARIGEAGYSTVKAGYSTDAMVASTMAVYDEVTA